MRRDEKALHAAALGRAGGRAKSESKTAAARANGAKGGRPVKTITVGAGPGAEWTVHVDAGHVGYTASGQPAFAARTSAAAQWLRRHGYQYGTWELREVFRELPTGRCWA